jgi:hypothetical protein
VHRRLDLAVRDADVAQRSVVELAKRRNGAATDKIAGEGVPAGDDMPGKRGRLRESAMAAVRSGG